ncbi:MAG: amino acid permease [Gammaproteobacteria bacterium]|nr:amino acid permease [Gammaproteobacteria bacterium]
MAHELNRTLSLPLLVFYGVGTILGAGIYVLVGKVAAYSGMYAVMSFLLASILAGFSAFSYAELSVRYPKSAGEAVYIEQGFHRQHLSTIVGLLIVLMGSVSTATLMHGFVGYLHVFVDWPSTLVIIGLVALMLSIVIWGIGQSVFIAAVMTIAEVIGLLIILWVAGDSFTTLPDRLPELVPSLDAMAWSGILLGAFIAFYAYIGFEDIVNVAEEVKTPEKNLPRAIIIALVVTTLFYILIATVSILTIQPSRLAESDAPLAMLYQASTGQSPTVITVISLASVLNGALIQIIMASRVLYGMGRQGWLPAHLGKVHGVTRTPVLASLTVGFIILTFSLILPLLSLAKLTSFITLSIFALINLALWRIKHRDSKTASFTVPLWVPICGFFSSSAFLLFQIIHFMRN